MFRTTALKTLRTPLAALLAVWLSGAVFLVCCSGMSAMSADVESCPLAKMAASHCDMARTADDGSLRVTRDSLPAIDCCAFMTAVFDKARKVEPGVKLAAVTPQIVKPTPARQIRLDQDRYSPDTLGHVPDRSRSFVTNRVFRI